jgi:hypothetical protein
MESAIVSIVSVALIIVATVTMMMNTLSSTSTLIDSWIKMEREAEEKRRTEISAVPPEEYGGGIIDMLVRNEGETKLNSFDKWDIIARYQTGGICYIDYTDNPNPGSNQWTLEGIYQTDNLTMSEIFDPGILNPGETVKMNINLDPEIGEGESGLITTSTSKGVTSQCLISRQ